MTAERKDIHNAGIPVLCEACEARHRGVCGALSPEQLVALSRTSSRKVIEAGNEVVGDAETVTSYANVIRGVVKLSKTMSDGRQQIVGLQFPPDFLGRPFIAESRLTAESATEVELCSFPKRAVDRMIADTPGLEHKLLQQALKELDEARDWMLTLGRKTATEKVASFLYQIVIHLDPAAAGRSGPVSMFLPLTRADMADYLGLTIETVSRQMTKLKTQGVIRLPDTRRIEVPDLDRLRRAAG